MSSGNDTKPADSSQESSSDNNAQQYSQTPSRRQSRTPGTPRKRRRVESVERPHIRKHYLKGRYNDAYRVLFNDDVSRAAARFEPSEAVNHYSTQYGASTWSGREQAILFVALERLGRDDVPGIAQAIGTKSTTETRELLLLLDDAAARQKDAGLLLRDIPAALELGHDCVQELDVMADALAWYQEQFEVAQEQERYGNYWLITPAVAGDIEDAIKGPSRASSTRPTTPADPGTPGTGPGTAGSCVRCKHHKIRCDRKVPCGNCARMKKKVVCEYKPSKRNTHSVHPPPQTPGVEKAEEEAAQPDVPANLQILQAIPQANLLHAENLLSLSKDLFMNRSPDIPSPWPHWSTYASEHVAEPSILRTAFNDFHTLAVSVTKRLMQTAIMQATSRLRSQRRRTKKSVMPFVKTRDVLSAIDILGLKRNGRAQWTGVARRCNVRVFDEQRTTRFKIKQREISWDQAEQILGLYDAATAPPANGMTASRPATDTRDEDVFKQRAARSGTPLPIEHLLLSNTDSDMETDDDEATYNREDSGEESTRPTRHYMRDSTGRYTGIAPGETTQNYVPEEQTLEQFDQEASRQEEEALGSLLGFTATSQRKPPSTNGSDDDDAEGREKLTTSANDWRTWTEYQAVWEEYQTPIPTARFTANQKPRETTSAARFRRCHNVSDELTEDSDASATSSNDSRQPKPKKPGVVELRARDPRVYAAMQSDAFGIHNDPSKSDLSGSDDYSDADVPAQSVENTEIAQNTEVQDMMDWEA